MSESLTDKLAAFFRAQPLTWIDGKELATIGGFYAWRSRVSDCRTRLGMTIETRPVYVYVHARRCPAVTAWDVEGACQCQKQRRIQRSEYRYVPAEAPQPATVTGHDLNAAPQGRLL